MDVKFYCWTIKLKTGKSQSVLIRLKNLTTIILNLIDYLFLGVNSAVGYYFLRLKEIKYGVMIVVCNKLF